MGRAVFECSRFSPLLSLTPQILTYSSRLLVSTKPTPSRGCHGHEEPILQAHAEETQPTRTHKHTMTKPENNVRKPEKMSKNTHTQPPPQKKKTHTHTHTTPLSSMDGRSPSRKQRPTPRYSFVSGGVSSMVLRLLGSSKVRGTSRKIWLS